MLVLLALATAGCHGSRWAKRDADYAQQYPRHTDNVAKTVKQAIDARHVRGKRGYYIAGTGRDYERTPSCPPIDCSSPTDWEFLTPEPKIRAPATSPYADLAIDENHIDGTQPAVAAPLSGKGTPPELPQLPSLEVNGSPPPLTEYCR